MFFIRPSFTLPFFRNFLIGFLLLPYCSTLAQENLSVLTYWKHNDHQAYPLYQQVYEKAFAQLNARKKEISSLKTRQDWKRRQQIVKLKLKQSIGPFPEKTPLNTIITNIIERKGIRVEKLYFESMPGYYVTAALFMPANRTGKLPAILYTCGHSANGFRSKAYQQLILNYVRKGFAVLTFDPIGQGERRQYQSDSTRRFGPTHEHSYPGAQSFVADTSPAMYFIWDGIRAIDYLLTRPEIDASRIGVAGRSGGGTQTAYIAALDNRVLAAAPEAYLTSFDKLLRSNGPQDAEQNLMGFLSSGLDLADLVEVRAPKPTMMVTTTRDIFSIEGARETFREAKLAYKALGATDNLTMVEDDAEHASTVKNREAAYAFFQKYLHNPGSSADESIPYFSDQELQVTPTGNVYTSLTSETLFSLIRKRIPAAPSQPLARQTLQKQVISLTGYETPRLNEVIFSGQYQRSGYVIEKYLINGPGTYYLPVLWLKPHSPSNRVVVYLHDKGKSEALRSNAVEQWVKQGYTVVLPDLSGAGELAQTYFSGGDSFIDSTSLNLWYAGILTRKSLVGVRMEEIRLLTDFIKKTVPGASLTAIGSGTFCADLLHAAVANPGFDGIVLFNGLVSYRSLATTEHYKTRFIPSAVAGALPHYDLPDLVTCLADRPVLLTGVIDATGQYISQKRLNQLYISGIGKQLSVSADADAETQQQHVMRWLQKFSL